MYNFKKCFDLITILLLAEQHNKSLIKNYLSRPIGAKTLPEAYAVTSNDSICGQKLCRECGYCHVHGYN